MIGNCKLRWDLISTDITGGKNGSVSLHPCVQSLLVISCVFIIAFEEQASEDLYPLLSIEEVAPCLTYLKLPAQNLLCAKYVPCHRATEFIGKKRGQPPSP